MRALSSSWPRLWLFEAIVGRYHALAECRHCRLQLWESYLCQCLAVRDNSTVEIKQKELLSAELLFFVSELTTVVALPSMRVCSLTTTPVLPYLSGKTSGSLRPFVQREDKASATENAGYCANRPEIAILLNKCERRSCAWIAPTRPKLGRLARKLAPVWFVGFGLSCDGT